MNWTSVNDSLPLDETEYLVTDGTNVTLASYLRWSNRSGWTVGKAYGAITYWAVLPEPPVNPS